MIAGRIFDKLSEDSRPELQFFDGTLLSADDSPIRVYGKAVMNIQLGDKHVRHMVSLMRDSLAQTSWDCY